MDFWFILLVKTWPQGCHNLVNCQSCLVTCTNRICWFSFCCVHHSWYQLARFVPDGPKIGEQVLQIFIPLSHFLGVRVEA